MIENSKKYKVGRDALTEKEIETLMNGFDKISDKALILDCAQLVDSKLSYDI
jgi:hypothetical protein